MQPPREPRLPTRRSVLGGLAGLGGAALLGSRSLPARSRATAIWAVEAVATSQAFGDGSTVPFFRYRTVPGYHGTDRGAIPFFEATEGDTVILAVRNLLPAAIQPEILGVARGPVIPPGATDHFSFQMPPAGTWLLSQARLAPLSSALGLGGVLVSRPTSGLKELWNGGPAYDREYVLLYQDSDDRWNRAAAQGVRPNLSTYEPNFFTVNGLAYPDLPADPDSRVVCNLGERVLLRIGNLGHMRQAIHFHGFHVEIAARNNVPETTLPPKDTVPVPHDTTADLILVPDKRGLFPLHPHSLTAVTANGLYLYGQLNMMEVL